MLPEATPLARALRRFLRKQPDLLPANARVLVALSGGRDSVVLLHLLRFARVADCRLHAAHFDHAMRAGSAEDAAWVRGLARAWDVPLVSARSDRPLRSEAGARARRYAFLEDAMHRAGADRLATAHHAGDQVETVLFRLLRGTGVPGLAGIPLRRGAIVRPLLPFSGRRIAAYARVVGLRWREDPTNMETGFRRNFLRHAVLPALEVAAPGTRRALAHLGRRAAEAERVLHPLVAAAERLAVTTEGDARVLARDVLLAYDARVRARVVHRSLLRSGARVDRGTVERAIAFMDRARSGAVLELGGGLRLTRDFERFVLFRPIEPPADRPLKLAEPAGTGSVRLGGRAVRVAWGPRPAPGGWTAALDGEALEFPLTVRAWRPGDRIRLAYGSKKLSKLFAERRLARSERSRVPVLADSAGRVLCVAGIAIAHPAEVRPGHTTWYFTVFE